MNRVKYDVLAAALDRIANEAALPVADMVNIARLALADASQVVEYRITARTWYGKNGGEFQAELCTTDGNLELFRVSGSTWGSDAWAYAMRDAMHAKRPDLFPAHAGAHPTIYFRDTCRVEYDHAEVPRKRDLK